MKLKQKNEKIITNQKSKFLPPHLERSIKKILILLVLILFTQDNGLTDDSTVPGSHESDIAALPQRAPVTPESVFDLQVVGEPAFHPDGQRIAFSVTWMDREGNTRYSSIWVQDLEEDEPRRFTWGSHRDRSPIWSPDGEQLAFVSNRGGSSQLWVLPIGGGEARQITDVEGGVSSPEWSPDSRSVVFLSRTEPPERRSNTAPLTKGFDHPENDVKVFSRLLYRFNGPGFWDGKNSHLWVVEVESGDARQITQGDYEDSDPQWAPDGSAVVFVSNRSKRPDHNSNTDLWLVSASGGSLTQLTTNEHADSSPRWQPGETTLLYSSTRHSGDQAEFWRLDFSRDGGTLRPGRPSQVTDQEELSVGTPIWVSSNQVLFTSGHRGNSQIFRVELTDGSVEPITDHERQLRNLTAAPATGRLVYTASDPIHPEELFAADLEGDNEVRVTSFNDDWVARHELVSVERFSYEGDLGWDVDGFFMRPVGWREGVSYPMVLEIHGGPPGMYGMNFFPEFQILAGRGYAVVFTNPRGSSGYGQAFQEAVEGDWGSGDYRDIMAGVDAALERYPWIDSQRLGVTGGSYGGYMTNWIVGQTQRFAAAVTQRSISNIVNFYGTTDIPYTLDQYFHGHPWTEFDLYWDRSPIKYAANMRTPLLVIHSERDYRCTIDQGEQMYVALLRQGVPAEFARYPRENHGLSRTGEPAHLVDRLTRIVEWFDHYLAAKTQ